MKGGVGVAEHRPRVAPCAGAGGRLWRQQRAKSREAQRREEDDPLHEDIYVAGSPSVTERAC